MIARCLLAALLLCLLSAPGLARTGTVHTKDGRTIEGDIADKGADGVSITTRAGQITIAASEVASVEYAGNIREAYEKRVAALPKNAGARTHYDIARWLYDNKEYELARKELDTALTLEPNFEDAALLKQTVDRTMLLEKSRPNPNPNPAVRPPANGATKPAVGGPIKDRKLLNADQINKIRQAELRNDDRVRVKLEKDVVKKFVEMNNIDPRQFATLSDASKALEILKNGTKEMRENVKIVSDPVAILEYKNKVQPALLQGCATSGCHGGSAAGKFVLYAPADNDAISYTNFYILNKYRQTVKAGGQAKDLRTIDRLYAGNSLILQYGLTRDRSEFDHPEVAGWMHTYRAGTQDPKYQQVFDWIRNVLIPVEPDYGIDFPLPGQQPASTQPADQPKPPAADQPKAKDNTGAGGQNANANAPDKGGDRDQKLDDARGRIKPINPGAIAVPSIGTVPF